MKKLFYTLGAVAATVTPVVAVVSCGSQDKTIQLNTIEKIIGGRHDSSKTEWTGCHYISDVNAYLNRNLVLKDPSANIDHLDYGFQSLTRFGDQELVQFGLDNGWYDEAVRLNNIHHWSKETDKEKIAIAEYKKGAGFERFNGEFQIFESIYLEPRADFDYTNGGELVFEFNVKDNKDLEAHAHYSRLLTADKKSSIHLAPATIAKLRNYSVSEATNKDKAKEAIEALANIFSNIDETNKSVLKSYFDEENWNFLQTEMAKESAKDYIHTHLDDIYDKFVKYPGVDATLLEGMLPGFQKPSLDKLLPWLIMDKGEKNNLIFGIRLLKFIYENDHKTA